MVKQHPCTIFATFGNDSWVGKFVNGEVAWSVHLGILMELRVLPPLPFVRLSPYALVGVFGVSSQLDAGTLTVDGCGCFLHGANIGIH